MWPRRRLCLLALCCLICPSASAHRIELQTPPAAGSPSPAIDADTLARIKTLKLQAQVAMDDQDLQKALRLYKQILGFDPDDALAQRKSDELTATIDKKKANDLEGKVKAEDEAATRARAQDSLTKAENALIDAKRTGSAEALRRAQQSFVDARKYARPGDPNIDRLQVLLDQEVATRNLRFWEFWIFVGLVVLGLVAALVFYFRRSGRALEMIEGPQMGQVFVLQKEATALGALASEVDWAIEDPLRKISRRHCDVVRQGRHYFLVDCSLNGTFLNGRALQKGQPALLKRGDQIGLGGEVTLRFR
jgi:hypothetical protein